MHLKFATLKNLQPLQPLCFGRALYPSLQRYLAHDLEEDDEDLKYHVMQWGLGWRKRGDAEYFLQLRDLLWTAMDYRACVSLKCCHQVMQVSSFSKLWERERNVAHSGAVREYEPEEECICCHSELIRCYVTDLDTEESDESDWEDEPAVKRIRYLEE